MRRALAGLVVAAAVLLAAACASGRVGTKAGGPAAPITLTIGTDGTPGFPAADAVEEFARQLEALSGGSLRISPKWNAGGAGNHAWDQVVAHLVEKGELDLGLVPTRAWDTEGVTSLRALTAPFLVTSNALADRILHSDLSAPMLAGLDRAGVVGIALWPEGLRHPFSFSTPLLGARDYAGRRFRAPKSDTAYAMFTALGASADDYPDLGEAVARGEVTAAEVSFELSDTLPRPAVATANVTFFPKVNSLVANPAFYRRLTDAQRNLVRAAADRTFDFAIKRRVPEATAAAQYCRDRGTVMLAASSDLASLEKAVGSVYTGLEADPTTRDLIAAIRAMKATPQRDMDPSVQACTPRTVSTPSTETAAFPEGVFRAALKASVVPEPSLVGTNTLTFRGGRWSHEDPEDAVCSGSYDVRGNRIHVVLQEPTCGHPAGTEVFNATWTFEHGDLRFTDVHSDADGDTFAQALWGAEPWHKIG